MGDLEELTFHLFGKCSVFAMQTVVEGQLNGRKEGSREHVFIWGTLCWLWRKEEEEGVE